MIEKPEVKLAKGTDLRQAVAIGFDEAFTSLEESFYDLSDEEARAFPLPGRNNIAWIVMHSLMNLDQYGPYTLRYLTFEGDGDHGQWAVDWGELRDRYRMGNTPQPGQEFPTVRQMLELLRTIRRQLDDVLRALTADDLRRPVRQWWTCAADACMRTIWHTAAHVRQIWLLRGSLGWRTGQSWPHQHWA